MNINLKNELTKSAVLMFYWVLFAIASNYAVQFGLQNKLHITTFDQAAAERFSGGSIVFEILILIFIVGIVSLAGKLIDVSDIVREELCRVFYNLGGLGVGVFYISLFYFNGGLSAFWHMILAYLGFSLLGLIVLYQLNLLGLVRDVLSLANSFGALIKKLVKP